MGSYTLTDPAGLALVTGTLHSLGDAGRLARQIGLRAGWVVDAQWRRVGRIQFGVMMHYEDEDDGGARR